MVEQPIRNRQVVGSTPTLGSNFLLMNWIASIRLLPLGAFRNILCHAARNRIRESNLWNFLAVSRN